MKHTHLKLCALFFFVFGLEGIYAQKSLPAVGGGGSGNGGTVSYTMGQLVVNTHTGAGGAVSQGVQQSYLISVIGSIKEAAGISLKVLAYPNPTTDILQLTIDDEISSGLSYQLYDIEGRLLVQDQIVAMLTKVNMQHLDAASYILRVRKENTLVKTFKIIKQ